MSDSRLYASGHVESGSVLRAGLSMSRSDFTISLVRQGARGDGAAIPSDSSCSG